MRLGPIRQHPPINFAPSSYQRAVSNSITAVSELPLQLRSSASYSSPEFGYTITSLLGAPDCIFLIREEIYFGAVQLTPIATTCSELSKSAAHSSIGVPSLICSPSRQEKLIHANFFFGDCSRRLSKIRAY